VCAIRRGFGVACRWRGRLRRIPATILVDGIFTKFPDARFTTLFERIIDKHCNACVLPCRIAG
jgi:hypothetical protein